jgi:RNA polymerase sigma factor (sigma-70 family)
MERENKAASEQRLDFVDQQPEIDPLVALSDALTTSEGSAIRPEQLPAMGWDIFRARREKNINGPAHRRLLLRAKAGDHYALEQLCVSVLPIINRVAQKSRSNLPLDEKQGVGLVAAIGAIQRFNVLQDEMSLSSFIEFRVRGSIKDEDRRENVWRGISRHDHSRLRALRKLITDTDSDVTPQQANDLLHEHMQKGEFPAGRARFDSEGSEQIEFHASIDMQLNSEGDEGPSGVAIGDRFEDDRAEIGFSEVDTQTYIESMLSLLPTRDKLIIIFSFGLYGQVEHTQVEIARKLGVHESRVSQLRTRALGSLRDAHSRGEVQA